MCLSLVVRLKRQLITFLISQSTPRVDCPQDQLIMLTKRIQVTSMVVKAGSVTLSVAYDGGTLCLFPGGYHEQEGRSC